MGKIRLSALISDGMVLQREVENDIWGYTEPGREIRLVLGGYEAVARAGGDGYFNLRLPKMQPGGPWKIYLSDGEDVITIDDVLFGDVFLLGGQSNMELPVVRVMERFGEEIKNTVKKDIRMFEVPKEYAFGEKRLEIENGHWMKAVGDELLLFSAAGYFAANELFEREHVPIGLLQTAVGGTPVKAWCCEETVKKLGYDVADLEECKQEGYPQQVEQTEAKYAEKWWKEALAGCDKRSGTIELPGFFSKTALNEFCGALTLRRKFNLPENINWMQEEATLYLGALIDADFTYINGKKVGETAYRYPPRIYEIPKGVLHAGENEVEVKMLVFNSEGGFMPGKEYEICYNDHGKQKVSLTGAWEYEIIKAMPELPETTFFQYKAAGLYQGMLYPVRKWKIKGCFFYQGESNTGRPKTYEEEFSAMIADWRELWNEPEMPFVFVQLAGFADGKERTKGTNWAKLREKQRCTEEHVENTRMVQAYDLGEYNDLHPIDKKTVGMRIAMAAEELIYRKNATGRDATVKEVKRLQGKVEVTFTPKETVLHVVEKESGEQKVFGFEWIRKDKSRAEAVAELTGPAVVEVRLPEEEYIGISYAWNDCPLDANLYNEHGLPVVPFEVLFSEI